MAILCQLRSGKHAALSAHTIIGRSPACTFVIPAREVSGEHASIRFTGAGWVVRDLASRNGTWIDGSRLEAGQEATLRVGSRLAFGDQDDLWRVEQLDPPGACARCLEPPRLVHASGGVLLLPDSEEPELAIFSDGAGWSLERGSDTRAVRDGEALTVAGCRWHLILPGVLEPTAPARPDTRVRFRVSRDEEFAALELLQGDDVHSLPPRRHHYLLLTLARQRLRDHDLPPTSRGWIDQDDLANQLRLSTQTVNVHVFRARRELGELDEHLASQLVERRPGTRQLRFGLATAEISLI